MIHLEVCLSWRIVVLKNNENCRIGTVNKSLPVKVRLQNIRVEDTADGNQRTILDLNLSTQDLERRSRSTKWHPVGQ